MDGKPIEKADTMLLVAAGRVENSDMVWDEDFTTVGAEWGNTPTRAEGIPARIYLDNSEKVKVYSLDSSGNSIAEIPVGNSKGQQAFVIGAQFKTLWHLLKRD